ncbi:hypothetical protein LCL61_29140 [Amycolatopsis coloradensis]|uniref:Uncharacterized protein n=1 Tax=Amycolatopsis coloradensis TaxID=76021 RepID=A0ACD5BJQ1_9PSEU
MEAWLAAPAYVINRTMDVLAEQGDLPRPRSTRFLRGLGTNSALAISFVVVDLLSTTTTQSREM